MIAARLAEVRARVAAACARAGRAPGEVTLIAVTKTHPVELIREALAAGQTDFGENYVQELVPKQAALPQARWHFIGRLQRNKAKEIAGRVTLIHGVDSVALAEAIARRAEAAGVVQDVLAQVNVAGEASKGGVAPGELAALLATRPTGLRWRGLMIMPPPADDPETTRPYFRAARALARDHGLAELSMGMSSDYELSLIHI